MALTNLGIGLGRLGDYQAADVDFALLRGGGLEWLRAADARGGAHDLGGCLMRPLSVCHI